MNERDLQDTLRYGKVEEVKKLFSHSRNISFSLGRNPLHFAAINKDINVLIYLIDEIGLEPDCQTDRGITPLHEAALHGNTKAIQLLIERGADFTRKNFLGKDIIGILKAAEKFHLVSEVESIIKNAVIPLSSGNDDSDESSLRKRNASNAQKFSIFGKEAPSTEDIKTSFLEKKLK